MLDDFQIVILAAGKGTRMGGDLAKVLSPLGGKTMIEVLFDHLEPLHIKPIVVVGYQSQAVIDLLGDRATYAVQSEQLGTGHAVKQAHRVSRTAETIIVLYGDQPLVTAETVLNLIEAHSNNPGPLTLGTIKARDFEGWRNAFEKYGRIVRDDNEKVIKIVEYKDATDDEKLISEVNPAYFVFDAGWLWSNLEKLQNNNVQSEYYLTDLVGLAFKQNHEVIAIPITEHEGVGANTPEQLQTLEKLLQKEHTK